MECEMDAAPTLELLQLRVNAANVVLTAASVCFGFISAYITGLFFFLYKSPLVLRATAFMLLTFALLFVVLIAVGVSPLAGGMIAGGNPLDGTITDLVKSSVGAEQIANLVLSELPLIYVIGFLLATVLAASVYLALLYMTFFYRWQHT
jgi:hypothetical protein